MRSSTPDAVYQDAMTEAAALGLMTANGEATDYCQCTDCGRVFPTEGNFKTHRLRGECGDPATVGLETNSKGAWKAPFWGQAERTEPAAPTGQGAAA